MKKTRDLTVEILKGIRSDIQQTNARLETLRGDMEVGLRDVRSELAERFAELGHRLVDSEMRTATAIAELAGSVRDMTTYLRAQGDLRPRVERCELDILDIKRRLPAA